MRPDDAQFHPFLLRRGDTPVVGRTHHHIAGDQPLRRLRPGFPPLDIALDLVELGKRPAHAFRGRQYLVQLFSFDPVSKQGDFQGVLGTLA
ncbi:hypothetical protein D3C77_698650 [compost metagenome]